MKNSHRFFNPLKICVGLGVMILAVVIAVSTAFSHGGKHAGDDFTHLQALQKATQLYDELIGKGKLDSTWETGLEKVTLSNRQNSEKQEFMVVFHRSEGDPKAVYIFFDAAGKYAGSNFTGK